MDTTPKLSSIIIVMSGPFCPQDILNRLTDEEMKCFYEAFKEFDYNNDGHINTKELSK